MPSKLLIAAANAAHAVRHALLFAINVPNPLVDGVSVMQRVRKERDRKAKPKRAEKKAAPRIPCLAGAAPMVRAGQGLGCSAIVTGRTM
jgi:dihydrolipoamide dehydrogenase